jgi:hypothetical protein
MRADGVELSMKSPAPRFEDWLSGLLNEDVTQVRRLLADRTALHFLVAWSLYEAKCFSGYVRLGRMKSFSNRVLAEGFNLDRISENVAFFHARYQDPRLYGNLMHGQSCSRMDRILRLNLLSVAERDQVFFAAVVAYRYRNNMFHGNKGVASWLRYAEQIARCTAVIQVFISHAESIRPSLRERAA